MKLRIAEVNDLWFTLPVEKYGGAERVLYNLVDGLINKGHDVTLYAVGNSRTPAKLVSVYPRSMYEDGIARTNVIYPLLNILEAIEREKEYDIIHFHMNVETDYPALPLSKHIKDKVVFTLHFAAPSLKGYHDRDHFLKKFKDLHFISISNAQHKGMQYLNWIKTVYNGVDLRSLTFNNNPKEYFAWIGKFNPDKGAHLAIEAAKKAGVQLFIAGAIDNLDSTDYQYFKKHIKPNIDDEQIVYVGEVNDAQKNTFLNQAKALLNPILWNEPFGMVMAEALAAGTPVISFDNGAAAEIIENNRSGFIVSTVDEMVSKIKQIDTVDRKKCRQRAEDFFSQESMTAAYLQVFEDLVKKNHHSS